jgi:hypothetical protein
VCFYYLPFVVAYFKDCLSCVLLCTMLFWSSIAHITNSFVLSVFQLIVTNAIVLSRHIVTKATSSISQPDPLNVFLYRACEPENFQSDVDLCAASMLAWSLFGGAALYFILGTLIALLIAAECKRKGYPATFTAFWNSPFFLFCYFMNEKKKIDLLSIPNKLMGFRMWTHGHIHRILLCLYCLLTTGLIVYGMTKRTVDNNDLDANRKYNSDNSLCKWKLGGRRVITSETWKFKPITISY